MPNNRVDVSRLGGKVRALRRRENISQVELADRLGVSASYLNLIEANRRPLPANILIKLAQIFRIDLSEFVADEDARLIADLMEVYDDPMFRGYGLSNTDVREVAQASPSAARAIITLYRAYQAARESADALAAKSFDGEELPGASRSALPSEEVSDLIQRRGNYVDPLERAAERLWLEGRLDSDDLYPRLVNYLERWHGVRVEIARDGADGAIQRRFDRDKKILTISELLPTRSRTFQLAHQIGLLTQRDVLDELVDDPTLTTTQSKSLARVALANYFAAAVLMPYGPFLKAAQELRYDIDVLGRRFRVGFEQVCHRLTTLRRSGAEGVPFHMIRIDVAGNISKRFSASGIRFARFSGACPRWNVFAAFLTPGMIRIQLSTMPDGESFFCIARTIQKDSGGYHSQQPVLSIGLGCQVKYARQLVYSDGVDLDNLNTAVPVGVTCRLCERVDCEQRAFPSIRAPLHIDENLRGPTLYTSVTRPNG